MNRRVKLILEIRKKYRRNRVDKHPRPALRGCLKKKVWIKKDRITTDKTAGLDIFTQEF